MNTPIRRLAAATLVASLALVACGGDDDEGGAPATTESSDQASSDTGSTDDTSDTGSTDDTSSGTSGGSDGPDATVAPDLPAEYEGEVGPVEVIGDALPPLELEPGDPFDADPAYGTAAPVLVGENFDGETVRVDAAADGPTMVVFLAHWCPHCNDEIPVINELRDAGRFPDDLTIVGVSTAVNAGQPNFPPSEWIPEMDWTYPVIVDGVDLDDGSLIGADAYGLSGFPFITVIDADGNVAARWSGERPADTIISNIEQALA